MWQEARGVRITGCELRGWRNGQPWGVMPQGKLKPAGKPEKGQGAGCHNLEQQSRTFWISQTTSVPQTPIGDS